MGPLFLHDKSTEFHPSRLLSSFPPPSSFIFPLSPSDLGRPPVLSVAQDWVPILDKVFGQKWCSDVWQIKEMDGEAGAGTGRGLGEGRVEHAAPLSNRSVTLEPSPSSPQQDPRWTPLEDMEVFSPDEEAAGSQRDTSGPRHGHPHSPTGEPELLRLCDRKHTLCT